MAKNNVKSAWQFAPGIEVESTQDPRAALADALSSPPHRCMPAAARQPAAVRSSRPWPGARPRQRPTVLRVDKAQA